MIKEILYNIMNIYYKTWSYNDLRPKNSEDRPRAEPHKSRGLCDGDGIQYEKKIIEIKLIQDKYIQKYRWRKE